MHKNKIYYTQFNKHSSKTLVLLHGWNTAGSGSWEGFLDILKTKNIRIIAPDMPGFNRSSEPDKNWITKDYALWLKDFLDDLKINTKIYLAGHSFGGAIASNFTANFPEKVEKLVLIAPAIIRNNSQLEKQRLTKIQRVTKVFKKIFKLPPFCLFHNLAKKVWYKLISSPDYNQNSPKMKEIMKLVLKDDQQKMAKNISVKTLLCWGTEDTYTPYSQAKKVEQLIKNSKLITFHGINHGLHLHSKEKLAQEIIKFIEN